MSLRTRIAKALMPDTARKAVTGPGVAAYYNDRPLSSLGLNPTDRAAAYLRAYKVGWFYKAESRISMDIATMRRTLSPEDEVGDNETAILEADLTTPWRDLDPAHQLLRLMERPNPKQTGRQLFQKTQIRLDMAGWTHWYLEGAGPTGSSALPTAIYGISPTRLTPSFDRAGKLLGWVLDKDRNGGTPFETHEILTFSNESADDDQGQGVVEAVMAELPLGAQLAQHTSDLLSTGGRLAGMLWPKDRALDENEFVDAQRAWRNVASDPNAARRLLLFPEPMEYSSGAASPKDIMIPELSNLNRDTILTAFPISPYMLGVPHPGGLNSGESRREDRRDYWEGTIHPRVEILEEVIQSGLVSMYENVVGMTLDFDIEEPNLDDAASLIEKVAAFDALTAAGFDEQDAIEALELDAMKWTKPAPPPAPVAPIVTASDVGKQDGSTTTVPLAAPAAPTKSVERARDKVTDPSTRTAKQLLEDFFAAQRERVSASIRETVPKDPLKRTKTPSWWDAQREDSELERVMRTIYLTVGRGALQQVADTLGRFVLKGAMQGIMADLLRYGGQRIADINATTLQAITIELAEGTRRGYSLSQLIDGVPDEGFRGINAVGLGNGVDAWSDLRAETIARTECALSYNRATVTGYSEFGVTTLLAYDGDGDEECAARDGVEFSVDEALGIDDHPNGTLAWAPVVDKAVHEPEKTIQPVIHVHMGETKIATPDVRVVIEDGAIRSPEPPPVNVTFAEGAFRAGDVTVQPTEVTFAEGAIRAGDTHVTTPDVTFAEGAISSRVSIERAEIVEHVLTRTVIDYAPDGVTVVGDHEEPA